MRKNAEVLALRNSINLLQPVVTTDGCNLLKCLESREEVTCDQALFYKREEAKAIVDVVEQECLLRYVIAEF